VDALTPEDLAILDLESPTIAGHTCKVVVLDSGDAGPPTVDEVRDHVAARLSRVPRCCECLCLEPTLGWSDATPIAIADHVRAAPVWSQER
jgi:hypothetical protein